MVGFITLEDAKAHLRLDTSDEDALVQRLIDAASAKIETATGYVAVAREQTFAFDRFERQLELRLRPIAEAISAATPEAIKHAARLCVGHWFANREAVNIGNISTELPLSFADLVEDDRLRRV